ncbi:ArsA family ATPase [bacterium]|nr:ArsA family ATPase [bacterium]
MSNNLSPFLENKNLKLIFFGGKGGTGKTTSACAAALHLARLNREKKILLVSTDPAHSVGDSFDIIMSDRIIPIKETGNLWVWEMNAPKLGEEFKREHEVVTKKIFDKGTIFDAEDIDEFYKNTVPGMDEIMAVMELGRILKKGEYDLIILDTAPTGHTLRLLALPKKMEQWTNVLNLMYSKHRFISRAFTGRYKKDDADEFIEMQRQDLTRVKNLFASAQATEFVPVTIAEPLSIDETERLVRGLRKYGITAKSIIVNRIASGSECKFCSSRRKDQEDKLREIEEKFAEHILIKMPLFPYEIRGLERLNEYALILFGKVEAYNKPFGGLFSSPKLSFKVQTQALDLIKKDLKFILFGGKGGVGKTSIACATALRLAQEYPDKKILVFSTDPAHSVGDSFDYPIGNKITLVKDISNLWAYEIDAERLLEEWEEENVDRIQEVFQRFLGKGMDIVFDREIIEEMIKSTPAGLDEIFALNEIAGLIKEERFDIYILDTAPSGHLVNFLKMPQIMREWLKTFFRLILKYRGIVRMNEIAEDMIETSKKVRAVQKMLADTENTEFIGITIPEEMGVRELERLLANIRRLNVPCYNIVINQVIPPTNCNFCSRKSQEQQRYVQQVRKEKSSEYQVTELSLLPHKVKGIEDLTELSNAMYGKKKPKLQDDKVNVI